MKKLRLVYTHFSLDGETRAYMDVECTSWEVVNSLLVLYKKGGSSFVPLSSLFSFQEID